MTRKTPLLAPLAVALAACGSDRPYDCKVDDELLDLALECFLDEDCPCGAHCDMGMCGYECTSNRDCDAGTKCDAFGRCSDKKAPAHALPPSARPSGSLQVSRSGLLFTGAGDIRTLSLRAANTASGRIRVKAGTHVEVLCPGDAGFGPECWLDSQAPDALAGAVVSVRATSSVPADKPSLAGRVDFWSQHNGHATAGMTLVNVDYSPNSGGVRSAFVTEPGRYQGRMVLTGVGVQVPGPDGEAFAAVGDLTLPLEVEVQPDGTDALLLLNDATGAVFDETVLSLANFLGEVWLPGGVTDARFLEYGQVAQIAINQAVSLDGTITLNDSTFQANVVTSYSGLTVNSKQELRWHLHATRVGSLDPATLIRPGDEPLTASASERALQQWPVDIASGATSPIDAMCSSEPGAEDGSLLPQIATVNGTSLASGDLACQDEQPARTFPVVATERSSDTTIAAVNQCIDELAACTVDACDAPATTTCVDPQRVLAGVLHGVRLSASQQEQRLGHRLLQQWLTTHAWLATESHGAQRREIILADNVELEDDLVEILADSLKGWDPLLHPRVAEGLLSFDAGTWVQPDYRCDYTQDCTAFAAQSDFHVQPQGLPVTILSVLSNQADALERSYEHVQYLQADAERLDAVARDYLRRALVMRAYAQGLKEHAETADPAVALPWQGAWESESDRFASRLNNLFDRVVALENGENPLGIDEVDLPLYGVGDETSEQDRFYALSDYLLGVGNCTEGSSGGLAWSACRDANVSFDRVRDSFLDEQDRAFDYAQYLTAREDRKLALENEYGAALIALCGWPAAEYGISYVDVFDFIDDIDPDLCFRPGDPFVAALGIEDTPDDCGSDASSTVTASAAEIGAQLCLQAEHPELAPAIAPDCVEPLESLWDLTDNGRKKLDYVYLDPYAPDVYEFAVDGSEVLVPRGCFEDPPNVPRFGNSYNYIEELEEAGVGASFDALQRATATCEDRVVEFDSSRPAPADGASFAECVWTDDCPQNLACVNGTCQLAERIDPRPECYRGSLGAMQLSVAASAVTIRTAKQELEDHVRRYDIAVESCKILAETNAKREERTQAFNEAQEFLRAVAATADGVAAVSDQVAQTTGGSLTSFFSAGPRMVTAAAQVTSITMKASMDTAKDKHELAMMKLENGSEEAICYNNANAELVGVNAQTLRIEQAMLELQRQWIEFENMKEGTRDLIGSYKALYERELTMPVAPMVMDGWQDAEIDRYHRKMREAKRQAWLAMRALEYETQGDSQFESYREDILSARTPFDLERALQSMQSRLATGTVNGGSASQLLAVISFRDDVLQLLDESDLNTDSHNMTPEQRLQHMLASRAYAYEDEDGNYAGQRIPFTLAPIADADPDGPIVIPLRTATDCAERLWSVSASLVGSDLNPGSDTTFSRVLVEQRNTFSSQWCAPENRDSPMQTASTRPLRNLFADPTGEEDPYLVGASATDFTRARLSAYYDVTRAELEDEGYYNGDSLELAGRGLYGDYALLFPADEIRTAAAADAESPGLDLSRIEDVLLRFDYVSVAR